MKNTWTFNIFSKSLSFDILRLKWSNLGPSWSGSLRFLDSALDGSEVFSPIPLILKTYQQLKGRKSRERVMVEKLWILLSVFLSFLFHTQLSFYCANPSLEIEIVWKAKKIKIPCLWPPQNATQNCSRTKSVMGKPSILISFIVTSYARTDKYILCLGCWIFMAILQGWMRKDKGKSIMPHNKKNTTELKYVRWKVSQLHKKVAHTALL